MRHLIGSVAFVAAVAAAASFIENEFYLRIMFMICVYYLCAAGMNVLVGFAGQKSLGQAGLFAAGAYAVALLTTRYEVGPWLCSSRWPAVSRRSSAFSSRCLRCA